MSLKRRFIWGAIVLLLIIVYIWKIEPVRRERQALDAAIRWARLAPIPTGATQIHATKHDAFTWSAVYLSFHAPQADINAFIASSPGLSGIRPELLSPQHMYLPRSTKPHLKEEDLEKEERHIYFRDDVVTNDARWFDPTIRFRGRLYQVPESNSVTYGEVIVDDLRHIVYIHEDSE